MYDCLVATLYLLAGTPSSGRVSSFLNLYQKILLLTELQNFKACWFGTFQKNTLAVTGFRHNSNLGLTVENSILRDTGVMHYLDKTAI